MTASVRRPKGGGRSRLGPPLNPPLLEYSAVGIVIEEVGEPVVDVIGKVELRKFMEELRMTDGACQ